MRSPLCGAGAKTDGFSSFELRTHHSAALDVVFSVAGIGDLAARNVCRTFHKSGAPIQLRRADHKIFTDRQIRRAPDCGATRFWDIDFS